MSSVTFAPIGQLETWLDRDIIDVEKWVESPIEQQPSLATTTREPPQFVTLGLTVEGEGKHFKERFNTLAGVHSLSVIFKNDSHNVLKVLSNKLEELVKLPKCQNVLKYVSLQCPLLPILKFKCKCGWWLKIFRQISELDSHPIVFYRNIPIEFISLGKISRLIIGNRDHGQENVLPLNPLSNHSNPFFNCLPIHKSSLRFWIALHLNIVTTVIKRMMKKSKLELTFENWKHN